MARGAADFYTDHHTTLSEQGKKYNIPNCFECYCGKCEESWFTKEDPDNEEYTVHSGWKCPWSQDVLKVDLNVAHLCDFVGLKGIGEVKLRQLVKCRPFQDWDEVESVEGIGPKTIAKLQTKFIINFEPIHQVTEHSL